MYNSKNSFLHIDFCSIFDIIYMSFLLRIPRKRDMLFPPF